MPSVAFTTPQTNKQSIYKICKELEQEKHMTTSVTYKMKSNFS